MRWESEFPESEVFGSFTKVPRVIGQRNLLRYATCPERLVFYALLESRAPRSSVACVGVAKLAQKTGLKPSTVMKATRELQNQGLVSKLGYTDLRVLAYHLLPYEAEIPPEMATAIIERAPRAVRKKSMRPRDSRGRLLPRPNGTSENRQPSESEEHGPAVTSSPDDQGCQDSSGTGDQMSTASGHHLEHLRARAALRE